MDKLYYDAYVSLFKHFDYQSLATLLNCSNKKLYYVLIKYIKEKNIYTDIIRYDLKRIQYYHSLNSYNLDYIRNNIFAKGCSLEVFKYFLTPGIQLENIWWYVALGGNLDNMKYLKEQNDKYDSHTVFAAVRFGNLENIKWLIENSSFSLLNVRITCEAALQGNLENLQWLIKNGSPFIPDSHYDDCDVMGFAAQNGNIKNMEWLRENVCSLTNKTFAFAAQGKITHHIGYRDIGVVNIETLKWLKNNDCPWDEETFASAAENGNLENMKWLLNNGCPWNDDTFASAGENGNLKNMKWLLDNKCPWTAYTFACAADNGNLNNLKWLKDNGCPYDEWTWVSATRADLSVERIIENCEYLKSIHCPWNRLTFEHESDHSFDITIRQWLLANGYEYHMW